MNYENRPRNAEIESNPDFAGGILAAIADRLAALSAELAEQPLTYCIETSPGKSSTSSVLRELEFLLSHTVHHYALVAAMCRLQNLEPERAFGVAPSTLRYQQILTTCARQAGAPVIKATTSSSTGMSSISARLRSRRSSTSRQG